MCSQLSFQSPFSLSFLMLPINIFIDTMISLTLSLSLHFTLDSTPLTSFYITRLHFRPFLVP